MKKKILVFVGFIISVFLLAGCKESTLNETNFSEPLENAGMAVGDSIGVSLDNPSIKMWKVSYDGDGGEVQYLEFADETSAKNLYTTQIDTYKTITGKGSSGGSYYASQDGFFYYAALIDDKVVIATGKSKNWKTIREILDQMPQVP